MITSLKPRLGLRFMESFGIKKIALLVGCALFLVSITVSVILYKKYQDVSKKLASPQIDSQTELAGVIAKISDLMELPDETPTLATVLDKEKLKESPVFEKIENGDKLLFYNQSGRVIIYRPSTNKLIDILTIDPNALQNQQNNLQTPAVPLESSESSNTNQ